MQMLVFHVKPFNEEIWLLSVLFFLTKNVWGIWNKKGGVRKNAQYNVYIGFPPSSHNTFSLTNCNW